MRKLLEYPYRILWALWPGLLCTLSLHAADGPVVHIESGQLQGQSLSQGGASFLAIPYAAAPVGTLRWRDPRPVAHWSGVRDATHYAGACAQAPAGWNESLLATASEDCLYLNVWTPKFDGAARLPVMVWIHGGAFSGGSSTDPVFSGERFAIKGVVLVSLNYRLGVFGFLAHPELSKTSGHASSGNFGLLDQIAALKWVHRNIGRFGGDASSITVFGQSAGGMSVTALLASPRGHGLLDRAIVESGAIITPMRMQTLADAEAMGQRFAGDLDMAALRRLSAKQLLQRWQQLARPQLGVNLGPIVDHYVLAEDPADVFAKHGEQPIALIIGNNAREGFMPLSDADLPRALQDFYGEQASAALKLYDAQPGESHAADPVLGTPAAQWVTDSAFRCAAVITAARHAASGAPVYEYQFEQSLPGREAQGAAHSYEIPYVFANLSDQGPLGAPFSQADHALSDLMISYWSNFAKRGDPNASGLPQWPRFELQARRYLRLATAFADDALAAQGLRKDACGLYEGRVDELRDHADRR